MAAPGKDYGQPVYVKQLYSAMPYPGAIPGVPEGLEYLAVVDELIVKQQLELLEIFTGFECKNKYKIYNTVEQDVYYAYEESGFMQRICCAANRGFVFHIIDNYRREVLRLTRDFIFCLPGNWCAECCKHTITVTDSKGTKLGSMRLMFSWLLSRFGIFDENDDFIYEIWAPCCRFQCACYPVDMHFPINNAKDKTPVGDIRKVWAGCLQELCTKSDTYGVSFPMNLQVKHKALMLAAVFMIDFALYEESKDSNDGAIEIAA